MHKPSFQMLVGLSKCSDYLNAQIVIKTSEIRSERANNAQNTRQDPSKCTNLPTIFRNAQIVFKNVRNPHRKSKQCPKHTTGPQNVREHSVPTFQSLFRAKNVRESSPKTNSHRQSTILECQNWFPNQILNHLCQVENVNFGSMCHAVLGCTRVT